MRNPVLSLLAFAAGFTAMFVIGIATAGDVYTQGRTGSGTRTAVQFDEGGRAVSYSKGPGGGTVITANNPVRFSSMTVDAGGHIQGTGPRTALVPTQTGWKGPNRLVFHDMLTIPKPALSAAAVAGLRLLGPAGATLALLEGLEILEAYFDEATQTWVVPEQTNPPGAFYPDNHAWRLDSYNKVAGTDLIVAPIEGEHRSHLTVWPDEAFFPGQVTHTCSGGRQLMIYPQTGFLHAVELVHVNDDIKRVRATYHVETERDIHCSLQTTSAELITAVYEAHGTKVPWIPDMVPASDADLLSRINQHFDQNPFDVWESVQQAGTDIELPDNTPATLTPQDTQLETQPVTRTTTITHPDGSTTERVETTRQRLTLGSQGSTIGTNIVTYNVTNITTVTENGEVVEHSETTVDQPEAPPAPAPAPEPEDISFSDSEFPEIPELY